MFTGSVGIGGWFDMKSVFFKSLAGLAILLGVLLVLLILPPIGKHHKIPSMSMAPALVSGDLFYSSNYAYTFSADKIPTRGDIITFKPDGGRLIFIKRVIGLPGDKVQMRRGRLYLNQVLVERKLKGTELLHLKFKSEAEAYTLYAEQYAQDGQSFQIFERSDTAQLDNTAIFTVPKGYVFAMGDNRDNSYDSRVSASRGGAGFVPIQNIIGEVKYILVPTKSCKNDEGLFCPKRKFFHKL